MPYKRNAVYNYLMIKEIAKIYLSNKISATLIIPIGIARKYGLDKPEHVTVEETGNGILVRKLEIKGEDRN